MPQASNIVLADALGTPVNHTFVPLGPDSKGVFWFEDQSAAAGIGNWKISVEIRRPGPAKQGDNSSGRTNRVVLGLHEPILETLGNNSVSGVVPAPTLSYISRAIVDVIMPERATLQNRKDLRKMFALLLADTGNIIPVIENLQYIY